MKNVFSVKVLAEIAIFAAIAFALDLIQGSLFGKIWANGGSVGIAMVPIFVIAYRRGLIPGILCGLIVSVIQMLGGVYVFQGKTFNNGFMKVMGPFFQVMLDYILAYTVVGLAGAFARGYHKSNKKSAKITFIVIGCVLAGTLKFLCHFMSGGFFWLDGYSKFGRFVSDSWMYTFVYNVTYSVPCIILSTAIMVIICLTYPDLLVAKDLNKEEADFKENISNNNPKLESVQAIKVEDKHE